MSEGPPLSVCVSTYNRAAGLDRLLEALTAQLPPRSFEVVVYDDASSDDTAEVLRRWKAGGRLDLVVLRGDRNVGPARGRNTAWRAATGRRVLFTDDDCVPTTGWVDAHLAAAADGVDVIVGAVAPNPEHAHRDGPFSRTLVVSDASYFQTANTSYPRELLDRAGGFDERFRLAAGEDTELGLRCEELGATKAFSAAALVHHDVSASSLRGALRVARKWTDLPLVVRQHPDTRETLMHRRWFWKASHPPTVMALAGLVLSLRWRWALVLLAPWLRFRTRVWVTSHDKRSWPVVLPEQFLVDLTEVATMVRGSIRHRTPLL